MSETGNLTYLHKVLEQSVKDGKSFTHEESVIHGPRGLSIKYYSKKDDDVEKINTKLIFQKLCTQEVKF